MNQHSIARTLSQPVLLQLWVACFAILSWSAHAQIKVKVNSTMSSPALNGLQVPMSPYNMPADCNNVGVCIPYNFTIPPTTLWTWCGWSTIKRTDYLILASGSITAALMSTHYLNDCALPNLAGMSTCYTVYGSSCTGTNCTTRVLALAFNRESCLVIANSGSKAVKVGVQVFQYNDQPRYYGAVFSIILAILFLGGGFLNVIRICYNEYTAPSDRIHELRAFESQLEQSDSLSGNSSSEDLKADQDKISEPSDPGSFQGRVKVALGKAKNLILRNKGPSQE